MQTSIKLKFRPSVISGKEGTLYYQLIHERRVKQIRTHYRIKVDEWDDVNECIVSFGKDSLRKHQLDSILRCVKWDIHRLEKIIEDYNEKGYHIN